MKRIPTPTSDKIGFQKPKRFRRGLRIYAIYRRKESRYLAVRLCNGKQRSTRSQTKAEARAFAYRWMAAEYPHLARQIDIATTPEIPFLKV